VVEFQQAGGSAHVRHVDVSWSEIVDCPRPGVENEDHVHTETVVVEAETGGGVGDAEQEVIEADF